MCEFRIGQKVVYVGGGGPRVKWDRSYKETSPTLIRGAVYTVRWVGIQQFDKMSHLPDGSLPAIRVAEFARTFSHGLFHDYPFGAVYFRPLVADDSRYDISIFLRICSDVSKGKSRVTVEGVRS